MVNIAEAYLKYKGQCVILVSGFSGSGKTTLAKFLASLFKFKLINQNNYHVPKDTYDIEKNYVILKNESKVLNWDNIYESVDWNKFNDDINNFKTHGIIVCGFGFPKSLLKFTPDCHLHIKISKQNLIKNREEYYDRNKMVDIDHRLPLSGVDHRLPLSGIDHRLPLSGVDSTYISKLWKCDKLCTNPEYRKKSF